MPLRRRRGKGDAVPTHAKDPNPAPVHARRETGTAHAGPRPRIPLPALDAAWSIPLAACAVATVCIVAIAIPAAILSGGSEPDPGLSAEVREAPVEEGASQGGDVAEVALAGDALGFGADLAARADALGRAATSLGRAVGAIRARGYEVGYYVATPDGQEVVALNADLPFYGASSIKGPFVLQAFAEGVPEGYRGLVEAAIQWSDNDAYYALRASRGYDVLSDQLLSIGVEGFTPFMSYVWMTPRQLAQVWEMELGTLSLEGEPGDWLRQVFSGTMNSALGALPAGGAVPVATAYSKAGWIDTEDLHCTVDAGVVTLAGPDGQGTGPTYVIAAMTDKGEDFEALGAVENALVTYLAAAAALG